MKPETIKLQQKKSIYSETSLLQTAWGCPN